jgi:hypothetical protein
LKDALAFLSREFTFPVTETSLQTALQRYASTHIRANLGIDLAAERLAGTCVDNRPTERWLPVAEAIELPDDSSTTRDIGPTYGFASGPAEPPAFFVDETADEIAMLRLKRENAAHEVARKRLIQDLADREEQIQILKELRASKPLGPVVARSTVGAMQRQAVPVMLCSDWHVEEPVNPAAISGLNRYDLDIADRCITDMADAYEWMLRDPRFDCRQGVVWLGGDLYSGYIHEELVEGNFLSPTQAVLWLQERIERMLRSIAAQCPNLERIIVPCNDGNHGRLTHKIRVSTRTANSLEWLLYKTLAARMADDPRFEFDIADGDWTYVDVFNRTLAFTHGDSFQYGGGVGGISIPIRRGISRQFQHRKVDYFSLGHFHQRNDFGDIAVNGSMIGFNAYAQRIHASPEKRQQSWFLIDSERGKFISAPIPLPDTSVVA